MFMECSEWEEFKGNLTPSFYSMLKSNTDLFPLFREL
jgi:hypothetical protein